MKNDILLDMTGIVTMMDAEIKLSLAWDECEESLAFFADAVSNMLDATVRLKRDFEELLEAAMIMTFLSPYEDDVERVVNDERLQSLADIFRIIRG